MALLNVLLSGSWRVSATGGMSAGNSFSAMTPLTALLGSLSVFIQQTVVLGTTVSELRLSYPNISSPQLIFLTANNELRINFAGHSAATSAASSAVTKFKEAFIMMDTSGLLPSGVSLGNSGTDSATCTYLIAG